MRYFTKLVIICFFFSIFSCKKEDPKTPDVLIGTWDWIYTWNDGAPGPTNPATPANSGINETVIFYSDFSTIHSYSSPFIDFIRPNRETFSLGHGSYTPYAGAYTYSYDSIVYYHSDKTITVDYFKASNDTLIFSSGFRGLSGGGSKTYVKQAD
jgi:hypothetical protein